MTTTEKPTTAKPPLPTLYSIEEVAAMVSLTTTGLRNIVRRGEFPRPFRVGRRVLRWDGEVIRNWLAAQEESN
jgi:predicted DNA-binding transcriptional regulator AlpA